MTITLQKLLTPNDVAGFLQVSVKTVYKHKNRFGGFYPAGLKRLRFKEDIINGILQGPKTEGLDIQVPVSGQELRGPGVYNQKRSNGSQGRQEKRIKESTARSNRHGIFGSV
jgi:hypothetical protein